ncbi:glycerol uptake facilitator-like aquaporin [Agromyces terreus]|uniref:Glycerol uptake facilitator-like aquaporin n=1 Tax=Agromyces terreus TaxID=424795 RepID=A0A9X2KBR4_9MICO|nr:MIP/aquaporin family protein [Agromyces terreus]MCP2370420.1 glycerol uptake facilitator-like aquaporin [Agromyces terreus]
MASDESPRPESAPLARRLLAEFLGTGLLVAIVVGSGIAASELSPGDVGLQLLENSLATTLGLAVLIAVFAPLSGAHFNPVVSLADWALHRRGGPGGFQAADLAPYVAAQVFGAVGGALLANAMFGAPAAISSTDRAAPAAFLAEAVATAGLVLVIFGLVRAGRTSIIPAAVGAYIGAAYWFTSSTSFANPAVTIGRVFSDTFAGIAPTSVAPFIGAQLLGGLVGVALVSLLFPIGSPKPVPSPVEAARLDEAASPSAADRPTPVANS